MAFDFTLDLGNDNVKNVDAGDRLPAGWYLAVVDDVVEDPKKPNMIFRFKVQAPADFADRTVSYWLPDPTAIDGEGDRKKAENRVKMFARRIGLINDHDLGKDGVAKSWLDTIGTQVFLFCEKSKDSDFVGVAYAGVYPLDYGRIEGQAFAKSFPASLEQYRTFKGTPAAHGGAGGTNGATGHAAAAPIAHAAANASAPAVDPYAGL